MLPAVLSDLASTKPGIVFDLPIIPEHKTRVCSGSSRVYLSSHSISPDFELFRLEFKISRPDSTVNRDAHSVLAFSLSCLALVSSYSCLYVV